MVRVGVEFGFVEGEPVAEVQGHYLACLESAKKVSICKKLDPISQCQVSGLLYNKNLYLPTAPLYESDCKGISCWIIMIKNFKVGPGRSGLLA